MAFNILIVDDSLTTRAIIRRVLVMSGLSLGEVYEAGNGQLALDLMREHWVDLVLADLNMPVMDGHQMIEAMASDPALRALPVIVVSSEGDRVVLESLAQMGVKQCIRKPFDPTLLRQVIERSLGLLAPEA